MSVSPRAADAIRKVAGYALAIALTWLLFRVLGRLAEGTQRLDDVEWVALLALAGVALAWVRAARRVRGPRPPPSPEGDRPQ